MLILNQVIKYSRVVKLSDRIPFVPDLSNLPPNRLLPSERRMVDWGARKGSGDCGILLEGDKLVTEALDNGIGLIAGWFVEDFVRSGAPILRRLSRAGCRMRLVSARIMERISSLETPPGVVCVGREPRFNHLSPNETFNLIVALMQVQDPGNLGAVIRTAAFFGTDEVWVGAGSADPYSPKVLRGSMGANFQLPVIAVSDIRKRISAFRENGAKVWAAVAHGDAQGGITGDGGIILMMGGESRGLIREELSIADHFIRLSGTGRMESLNLAVAAGILIHQVMAGKTYNSIGRA